MLINSGLSDSFYGSSSSSLNIHWREFKNSKEQQSCTFSHNYKPSSWYQTTLLKSGESKKPQPEYFIRIDISSSKSEYMNWIKVAFKNACLIIILSVRFETR